MTRKATLTTLTALSAVLALGFAVAGQSAFAQTEDTLSVKVPYQDLNLSSQAGAKVMLQRIRNAASTICGPAPTDPIDRMNNYAPCVTEVTNRSVASFNNPFVTALNGGDKSAAPTTLASAR